MRSKGSKAKRDIQVDISASIQFQGNTVTRRNNDTSRSLQASEAPHWPGDFTLDIQQLH